jgi:hypothetical protein
MNRLIKRTAVAAFSVAVFPVYAATWVPDARSGGMGNTGVTTADFLLAPFHNPALTAVYRNEDDFGLLLPSLQINVRDSDETLSTVDDLQDTIDRFEAVGVGSVDASTVNQLDSYLDQLADDAALSASAGLGMAVAVPFREVSLNLYTRAYVEIVADTDIAASSGNTATDVQTRYQNSSVDLKAFGYTELGLAAARQYQLYGQRVAFGITPKIQQIRTYQETVTVKDFDLDDYDESKVEENAFNIDLGAVWLKDAYRVGVVVKDLFNQSVALSDRTDSYKLNTQIVVSGAYVTDFFQATIDVDATRQERFKQVDDDTQFVRLGVEGNAWGWAQLRAGYEIDLESTLDNSVTVGLGISPGDIVSFDLAASYAGDNQFGGSANLAFTF